MIKIYTTLFLGLVFTFLGSADLYAQKVLQIEKYGSPKTEKMFIGHSFSYKVKGDDAWRHAYIEDLLVDQDVIQLGRTYVKLEDIEAIRYDRKFGRRARNTLVLFGLSWSGYALIGTATDGNPETNYEWSDAIVTTSTALVGLALPKLFRYKTIRFGKRKRLRMLDLDFKDIRP